MNTNNDVLLERSERFWRMIARARRGKSIALETLRKQVIGRKVSREQGSARQRHAK